MEELEGDETNVTAAGDAHAANVLQKPESVDFDIKSTKSPAGSHTLADIEHQLINGTIRTLDGELAGDEMEQDAINYQILLDKIEKLLERLKLDA